MRIALGPSDIKVYDLLDLMGREKILFRIPVSFLMPS